MSSTIVNVHGFVLPNKIYIATKKTCDIINDLVVFQPNDHSYVGTVQWFGIINDEFDAYGIEMSLEMEAATNGTFNNQNLFQCKNGYGIVVLCPVKILKLNKQNRYIEDNEIAYDEVNLEYDNGDLVVIRTMNGNLRVGKLCNSGKVNDIKCYRINFIGEDKSNLYVSCDVLGRFINENGAVNIYGDKYNINDSNFTYNVKINEPIYFQYGNKERVGLLKWKGLIDGFRCLGIEPDDGKLTKDFTKVFDDKKAYWTVICLDNSNHIEIDDPHDVNIYTYFTLKAYVRLSDDTCGCVEKYAVDIKRNFYYGVKLDNEKDLKYIAIDDLKSATPTYIGAKAFSLVENPIDFGIKTIFNLKDYVKVLPTITNKLKKNSFGQIVWMGFDKESSFKFLIEMEDYIENGHSGILYGDKLFNVTDGKALLVYSSCVLPLDAPVKKDQILKNESQIVEEYVQQRYHITTGKESGIQGDKNSCYLDTSLFAMFTFQEVFDNILFAKKEDGKELQKFLKEYIIFPLRKHGFVSFNRVESVRQKLDQLFPGKMFVHSERDPEELLETLFHFLTPNDPFLITFHLVTRKKQPCFLTQLFYLNMGSQQNSVSIDDMVDWTFLESEILINKPPKCLILQLPRHGNKFKKFKEVNIKSKLDITHLIRYCKLKCFDCSKSAICFCKSCSDSKCKFTYFCEVHKSSCNHKKCYLTGDKKIHDKENMVGTNGSIQNNIYGSKKQKMVFKGNVEMELFAILCIDKTHYVAYVKTGQINDKWVFFDSMASIDGNLLHPLVREADISKYLQTGDDIILNEDVERIKQFAFVCFYKNPVMEFYSQDFNHIGK